MKILHLHTRYRQLGGEDTVVDAERQLLRSGGHEVIPLDFENALGGLRTAAQSLAAPWNPVPAGRVRQVARETRPDVAHVHNTWYAASPSVLRSLARTGIPVVWTLHNYRTTCIASTLSRDGAPCHLCVGRTGWAGVRYQCYRDSGAASLIAMLANVTAAKEREAVDRFIVLTDFARGLFVEAGLIPDRIRVVNNFSTDPGPRPAPPSTSDEVLFVGRLSPEKGIEGVLEAWSRAAPRHRLNVIGDGPLYAALRHRYPNIEFRGRLAPAEVGRLMLEARALVFPSQWYEGQSMVVLEAMAAGLPVLASDWPPIRETLGPVDDRWLVPAHDVRSWASRLDLLDEDTAIDAAGRRLRDRYEELHTPEKGLDRLTRVYEEVLS
jgi:glycosyltransferase involved in cell wall biosynthesis